MQVSTSPRTMVSRVCVVSGSMLCQERWEPARARQLPCVHLWRRRERPLPLPRSGTDSATGDPVAAGRGVVAGEAAARLAEEAARLLVARPPGAGPRARVSAGSTVVRVAGEAHAAAPAE